MDTFSKVERSRIMSSVKSKNNKSTELRFITILKDKGIKGWRRNYPLTGKPDFVFPRLKIAVFIDGCYWHGCPSHCRMPSSNINYWNDKIEKNKIRDKKITKTLKMKNWHVIRIWEHEIKTGKLNQKMNYPAASCEVSRNNKEVIPRCKHRGIPRLKRIRETAQQMHQHRQGLTLF